MTRLQHEATRALHHAEKEWLVSYGWKLSNHDRLDWDRVEAFGRFQHPKAPDTRPDYSLRDAVTMTRGDLLRYGSAIRSVG